MQTVGAALSEAAVNGRRRRSGKLQGSHSRARVEQRLNPDWPQLSARTGDNRNLIVESKQAVAHERASSELGVLNIS